MGDGSGSVHRRIRRCLGAVALAIPLAACLACGGRGPTPDPEQPAYRPVGSIRDTMEWILDPAADVVWGSAGFVITAEGETDLQPTSDAGWRRVRNSAALLAESGNLLMMPGRSAGPDWQAYARALGEAGRDTLAAAEAKDAQALFDAGGRLYQACPDCHTQYMVGAR